MDLTNVLLSINLFNLRASRKSKSLNLTRSDFVYCGFDIKVILSQNLARFLSFRRGGYVSLWPFLLTWFNFNPSMDK